MSSINYEAELFIAMRGTKTQDQKGILFLVSTPIGNLEDITLRALQCLKDVDLVLCEDKRVSAKLFQHFGFLPKKRSYNDFSGGHDRQKVIGMLEQGGRIALISDAGTPLISDPGYKLVQDCVARDIAVTSLPGANAVLPALQLSGFATHPFLFGGFLPHKDKAKLDMLKKWANSPVTLVFYDSPRRVEKTLACARQAMPNRNVSLIRELTKMFEEIITGTIADVQEQCGRHENLKGEMVVVFSPPSIEHFSIEDIDTDIDALLSMGANPKKLADYLAKKSGLPKKTIYNRAVSRKNVD